MSSADANRPPDMKRGAGQAPDDLTGPASAVPLMDLAAEFSGLRVQLGEAVLRVLASGRYINGPEVEAFEHAFADACHVPHAVGVSSGTDALRFALMAAGAFPDRRAGEAAPEVITSPFSFIATTEAISQAGARPVFADIDPATFNLDPRAVERALTPRTRAIVPVHLYGQPADMQPIIEAARHRRIAVIEDACQAHGALYRGQPAGSLGDAGCFSFYPTKNLGAYGDAGAVTTHDAGVAARVMRLRDHGQSEKYLHAEEGYNGRLDALQAAVLRVKLEHLAAWNERRRRLAALYLGELAGLERSGLLILPREAPGARHVWHQFSIRIPEDPAGTPQARDRVRASLRERGIETGVHYPVPLHLQPCYAALGLGPGAFPEAERAAREVLSLPMYPGLTDHQAGRVVESLRATLTGPAAAARPATASHPTTASHAAAAAPPAGPRFSVIIPTFNRADLVPETVASVLAQTCRDFEVIVVDDGSTDHTAEALAPYLDRIRYVRQPNRGLAAARNRGILEAAGEFVAFLDSDDLFEPAFLQRVLETFREHPDAGAVFVAEREFTDAAASNGRVFSKRTRGINFTPAGLIGRDTGVGSGRPPVIRRSWLERLGGFDETMRCAVDSEMWIRCSFRVPMVFQPEPLVRRRLHPGNLSRNRAADAEDWLIILDRLRRDRPAFARRHAALLRRTLGKHHLRLGAALLERQDDDPDRLDRARRELLRAIGAYPLFARAYIYLAWSLAVPVSFGRWRRAFHARHAGQRHP